MCCSRVGISRIPIDVVSGHYSSIGIRAQAKKMLFKLDDKSHAIESHSLIYPQSFSDEAEASGASVTSGGQNRKFNRWGTGRSALIWGRLGPGTSRPVGGCSGLTDDLEWVTGVLHLSLFIYKVGLMILTHRCLWDFHALDTTDIKTLKT